MNSCTRINPPIVRLKNWKYSKQITVPGCSILMVTHNHVGWLGVLSWFLELLWALGSPMFLWTTCETGSFFLILVEGLLTLLLEVGILLDTRFPLGLVEVGVLLYKICDRSSLIPFSVRVLCSRILLDTQMANDILNWEFTPLVFQSCSKVPPGIRQLSDYASRDKFSR